MLLLSGAAASTAPASAQLMPLPSPACARDAAALPRPPPPPATPPCMTAGGGGFVCWGGGGVVCWADQVVNHRSQEPLASHMRQLKGADDAAKIARRKEAFMKKKKSGGGGGGDKQEL